MPAEMIKPVHVIDRSCAPETILEALVLTGGDDPLVCIGPLPEAVLAYEGAADRRRIASLPVSKLERQGGRILKHLAADDVVYHCWSARAAWEIDGALSDRPARLVVRLALPPTGAETTRLLQLANARQMALVFPGEFAAAVVRGRDIAAEIHVIPPPAAGPEPGAGGRSRLREQLGIAAGDVAIVAPGVVRRRSGHRLAVWAAGILAVAELPVRLIIQHTGRGARDVAAFARDTGSAGQTILADVSLPEALAAADIAVFLGRDFLPPALAASAMFAGLPIVASDTAGAREWLIHGENALLVRANQPRATARALMRLIQDKALAAELANASRAFAKGRFDPESVRRRWQKLYDSFPSSPGGAGPPAPKDMAS